MPARQSFNGGGDGQNFLRANGGTLKWVAGGLRNLMSLCF